MQGNNAGYRIGIAAVFAAALCQAQIGQAQSYTITTVAGGGNSVSGNGTDVIKRHIIRSIQCY